MFSVSGKIIDASTGYPIENATVVIAKEFGHSNEMGNYTIANLPLGDLKGTVLQRYYQKLEFMVNVTGNMVLDDIKLTLE